MQRSQTPPRQSSRPPRSAALEARQQSRLLRAVLLLLVVGGGLVMSSKALLPSLGRNQRYRLTTETVHLSPPPNWIRSDIRAEVMRTAGLENRLSLLDEDLFRRLREAFEGHPWVKRVVRIERNFPPSVNIQIEYRRPIAAVETRVAGRTLLLPVDAAAVRLPADDFTSAERQHLPRVLQIEGQPALGQVWNDARVQGAARLAELLADSWTKLGLVDIVPSRYPEVDGETRYFTFEIVTQGGTRIQWGPAPGEGPADEPSFDEKHAWLVEYADRAGPPVGISAPARIDVRRRLEVYPRQARKPKREAAEDAAKQH